MKGILADNNITGHVRVLAAHLEGPDWREIWESLQLRLQTFRELDLASDISDALLWRYCQEQQLVLLTANRNARGPDSLEATIRNENRNDSLPVFTLPDAERVLTSREYAERVTRRLLEYLTEFDNYRGTGRLFLP